MLKKPVWMIGLLVACLVCPVAQAQTFDFASVKEKITSFELDNGLRVIVMEDHSAPVVTCVTLADVGSADDPKGATGLAHVFEHMAFKGTTEVGTNDAESERVALNEVDDAYYAWRAEVLKDHLADSALLQEYWDQFKAAEEAADQYVVTNEFGKIVETNGGVGLNAGTASDFTIYFFSLPSNRVELWFALESGRFYERKVGENVRFGTRSC